MEINSTYSKDNDEDLVMHSKTENIGIMIMIKQMKLWKKVFNYLCLDNGLDWKRQ